MATFARMMCTRQTPIVVVIAYPATPLVTPQVRFCISAAHTKDDIDTILQACDELVLIDACTCTQTLWGCYVINETDEPEARRQCRYRCVDVHRTLGCII
ncbi:hypothetical protein J3R83DRAFT_7632 [Lanmaoa asiatica]|nr:hypothetical protein J3R83DRAFT_7632 [Lanmaoa asiatica]